MDEKHNKTCCFTGHREIPATERERLAADLKQTLLDLIRQGVCYFAAGGARGFDTLAAQTVLQLKEDDSHIRLILVLPCKDQTRGWSAEDKAQYEAVLSAADKTVWLAEHYHAGCMHARNRRLVDHADVCVCYLTRDTGGTAYTVRYAEKKGIPIHNLGTGL